MVVLSFASAVDARAARETVRAARQARAVVAASLSSLENEDSFTGDDVQRIELDARRRSLEGCFDLHGDESRQLLLVLLPVNNF